MKKLITTYVIFDAENEDNDQMFTSVDKTVAFMKVNNKRKEVVHKFQGSTFGKGKQVGQYKLVGKELVPLEFCYNTGCKAFDLFDSGYCPNCVVALKLPTEYVKEEWSGRDEELNERTDGDYVYE